MAERGLEGIDETVEKTHLWLNEIGRELHTEPHRSYLALRAFLHVLRDRLSTDEAAQFGAQLPMLIRGLFYEGWDPRATPEKTRVAEVFLARIAREAMLADDPPPAMAVRAVASVVRRHVTAGAFDDLLGTLPHGIRELFEARAGV